MTRTIKILVLVLSFGLISSGLDSLIGLVPEITGTSIRLDVTPAVSGALTLLTAIVIVFSALTSRVKPLITSCVTAGAIQLMLALMEAPTIYSSGGFDNWQATSILITQSCVWFIIAASLSFRHGVYKIHLMRGRDNDVE